MKSQSKSTLINIFRATGKETVVFGIYTSSLWLGKVPYYAALSPLNKNHSSMREVSVTGTFFL